MRHLSQRKTQVEVVEGEEGKAVFGCELMAN